MFLNYNSEDGSRIGIDWSKDFCDPSHVNVNGATKLTRDLGENLNQVQSLNAAKRIDESLDEDAKKTLRTLDISKITELNLNSANWILNQTKSSLIMIYNGLPISPDMIKTLNDIGFGSINNATKNKTALAAINCTGKEEIVAMASTINSNFQLPYGKSVMSALVDKAAVSLKIDEAELAKSDAPVTIIYYDDVLKRPVFRMCFDNNGKLTVEDISFILRAKE